MFLARLTFCHVRSTLTSNMQETQLLLVQLQTIVAQIAFQVVAVLGLGLAWLTVVLGAGQIANAQSAFTRVASIARSLGLLWLIVLASAWPVLLERTGNVLGPLLLTTVVVLLITEAVIYRAAQTLPTPLRRLAGVAVALAYSLALALVVLAESWMNMPTGAALVDGRFQVVQWTDLIETAGFVEVYAATLLAALVLAAAWVQYGAAVTGEGCELGSARVRVPLTALAMAALVALLWLVAQTMPVSATFYSVLMGESGDSAASLLVRLTLVLWLLTMAGLLVSLTDRQFQLSNRTLGGLMKMPIVTAPLFWVLAWWQINGAAKHATVAGLPVADLVSTQPVWVLAIGCLLVGGVVLVALRLLMGLLLGSSQVSPSEVEHD